MANKTLIKQQQQKKTILYEITPAYYVTLPQKNDIRLKSGSSEFIWICNHAVLLVLIYVFSDECGSGKKICMQCRHSENTGGDRGYVFDLYSTHLHMGKFRIEALD